jgi:hypothetical protein
LIVLFDDLVARNPSTFQFMLHALKPFNVDERSAQLDLEQPGAGLQVKYLSPVPLFFRQWDGYEPKPDREFPNQWHVEAGTNERRKELGVLTVLVPYRAGGRRDWQAERLESASAVGVRVTGALRPTLIAFRKANVSGQASLAGMTFDGNVAVR